MSLPGQHKALNQRKPPKKQKSTVLGKAGSLKMLGRALTLGCPACGKRGHFKRWLIMADECHHCGLHFERIEGHWIGAIGINTIVGFGLLMIYIAVSLILTFPDFPVGALTIGAVAVSILVPIVFYPFSKTVWTAIDIAMRPLEVHEVDWTALDSDATSSQLDNPPQLDKPPQLDNSSNLDAESTNTDV